MKRILITALVFLLVTSMMGCPDVTTLPSEASAQPMPEMLFDLSEDMSIVSQSFHFELNESTAYLPDLNVKGTYVIQNDGEDAAIEMLYPIINEATLYDVRMLQSQLSVRINYLTETLDWRISNQALEPISAEDIHYDYFATDDFSGYVDPSTITVHEYRFDCPQRGTDETLTLNIPEGTYILYDYYMQLDEDVTDGLGYKNVQGQFFDHQGETTDIPSFSSPTYLTIYAIDQTIDFEANYDYNGYHKEQSLTAMIRDNQGATYQDQYLVYKMAEDMTKDIYSTALYDYVFSANHYLLQTKTMFTKSVMIEGGGAQTVIEVDFPQLGFGTSVSGDVRYLFYDFYLDQNRYVNQDIPVTLTLDSFYQIEPNSFGLEQPVTIYDFSQGLVIHLSFTMSNLETSS